MQKITVTLTICLFIWLAFVQSAPAEAKQKSEQAALYWSLGSTLIPTVVGLPMVARDKMDLEAIGAPLIIGGLLIGPSAGHWYAGEHGRG